MNKIKTLGFTVMMAMLPFAPVYGQDVVIRAGLTDPLDTPYGEAMQEFKRIVEDGSGGRIEVQLFPSAQLGALAEQLANVQSGAQEMTLISPAYSSQFFPALNVLELPFLVTNWDEAEQMLNSDAFGTLMADAEAAIDVRLVGNFPYGFRNVANSRGPVETLADMKGLKLRTQSSPVHIAAFEAMGASPVAIDWSETYQAVQTHVVDGLENANSVLIANKFPEIAPYVSVTHHLFGMLLVAMNAKVYESLSEEDKALVAKAMVAAEDVNLRRAKEIEAGSVEQLETMGATVNDVPADQVAAMRESISGVYERFGDRFEPYLSALRASVSQ
ncbi:TRAP transporter substrate-binding protein [Puniceibacterium sp. IMCC21224]|uniref:TRAP transporter substrate-binding protein n=1 Tax=Puniceibacterium sp. IMCC21224 TaxID=1618204 RepID=UPI00064E1108|nr:TRAP transporter substrate-binding protein [Puniceibacterium sp. IMCC21224]KMK64945.1 tripartite ATP-independent periplasmic transporter solute receptor, DctP family [Puniceibacterium sp. IMCC21224]